MKISTGLLFAYRAEITIVPAFPARFRLATYFYRFAQGGLKLVSITAP